VAIVTILASPIGWELRISGIPFYVLMAMFVIPFPYFLQWLFTLGTIYILNKFIPKSKKGSMYLLVSTLMMCVLTILYYKTSYEFAIKYQGIDEFTESIIINIGLFSASLTSIFVVLFKGNHKYNRIPLMINVLIICVYGFSYFGELP